MTPYIVSDAAIVVNSINGCSTSADLELVVQDCKILINELENASVTHVRKDYSLILKLIV